MIVSESSTPLLRCPTGSMWIPEQSSPPPNRCSPCAASVGAPLRRNESVFGDDHGLKLTQEGGRPRSEPTFRTRVCAAFSLLAPVSSEELGHPLVAPVPRIPRRIRKELPIGQVVELDNDFGQRLVVDIGERFPGFSTDH